MGDRMEYINQAINAIEAQDDTRVVHVSSLIETNHMAVWYRMIF